MLLGSLCALVSAVLYTGANICLRGVVHCDSFWVSCIKASPTAALAGLPLVWRIARGEQRWPTSRQVIGLIVTGLVGQIIGNVAFQHALGVVGIALSVPLCFGTLIVGGAVLGRVFLGEPITPQALVAMIVLAGAIAVLSSGAGPAEAAELPHEPSPGHGWHLIGAVTAACASGLAYALLGVVLRQAVRETGLMLTLFIVSVTGIVSLGLCTLARIGIEGIVATSQADWSLMIGAGLFNAVAFAILCQALQFAPVTHVNAFNSSQTAMAAVAGIWLFHEPITLSLGVGTAMTIGGLLLLERGRQVANGDKVKA